VTIRTSAEKLLNRRLLTPSGKLFALITITRSQAPSLRCRRRRTPGCPWRGAPRCLRRHQNAPRSDWLTRTLLSWTPTAPARLPFWIPPRTATAPHASPTSSLASLATPSHAFLARANRIVHL